MATAIGKISRVRLKTPLECLESDPMQVAFNKVTLLIAEAVRVRMILRWGLTLKKGTQIINLQTLITTTIVGRGPDFIEFKFDLMNYRYFWINAWFVNI